MKSEVYIPSEKEIQDQCAKLRQAWSETTEQSRLRFDWRTKPAFVKEIEPPEKSRLKPD